MRCGAVLRIGAVANGHGADRQRIPKKSITKPHPDILGLFRTVAGLARRRGNSRNDDTWWRIQKTSSFRSNPMIVGLLPGTSKSRGIGTSCAAVTEIIEGLIPNTGTLVSTVHMMARTKVRQIRCHLEEHMPLVETHYCKRTWPPWYSPTVPVLERSPM